MITKAWIEKIEQKIALTEELENKKNYQYIFHSHEEYEEAKKQGFIDPDPLVHIIILDV